MSTLILKPDNKSLHIKLNRPDVHNAFNPEMVQELTAVFSDTKDLEQYVCVVLRGEGPSFSAGGDLNWMKSMVKFSFEENLKDAKELFNMFDVMARCPVPLMGLVHGNVFGGGLGMVAACDIVYAEKDTRFSFSEVKLGLIPAVISPFVKRKVSSTFLREFMLTGDLFGVHKAQDMGLIHQSGELKDLYSEIDNKIKSIQSSGQEAVRLTKKLLNDLEGMDWAQAKEYAVKAISERRVSPEGQEGLKAFLEKRKPNWL